MQFNQSCVFYICIMKKLKIFFFRYEKSFVLFNPIVLLVAPGVHNGEVRKSLCNSIPGLENETDCIKLHCVSVSHVTCASCDTTIIISVPLELLDLYPKTNVQLKNLLISTNHSATSFLWATIK